MMYGSALAFVILAIPLIVILGILYYRSYTKRVNAVLNDEGAQSGRGLLSPASFLTRVCVVVLVVILLAISAKMASIQEQIENMQSNYSYQLDNLNRQIGELLEQQEAQNSLVSYSDYTFGKIDAKSNQVECILTINLKNFNEDTKVSAKISGTAYELTSDGSGSYQGSVMIPLFGTNPDEEGEVMNVTLIVSDKDSNQTEQLEMIYTPVWQECLPSIESGEFYCTSMPENIETGVSLVNLQKGSFVGDVTVQVMDIQEDALSSVSPDALKREIVDEYRFGKIDTLNSSENRIRIHGSLDARENKGKYSRCYYAVATDEYGYVHKGFMGVVDETEESYYDYARYMIYDQEGNLLAIQY